MPSQKKYTIGTRGSLLAVTQCTQIKRKLEKLTGDQFQLKLIETQGDQIADIPLWQADGKDFFTRELDRALLASEIDLVIHSYKDLGSVRPQNIHLAAVTKRYPCQDILLIKKETAQNLKEIKKLIVGTSAPRRMANLQSGLKEIFPLSLDLNLEIKVLRGNINNRIKKLQNNDYDAIVLAFAGLQRLAEEALINPQVEKELNEILNDLTFCVLPLTLFPSAASQGALAIECLLNREDQGELLKKIQLLSDQDTRDEVQKEREIFNQYGGGCHLAVGIAVKKIGPFYAHLERGENKGEIINKAYLKREIPLPNIKKLSISPTQVFFGMPPEKNKGEDFVSDLFISKIPMANKDNIKLQGHLLCAVDYALENMQIEREHSFLWAPNAHTMKKIGQKGHWVYGALDLEGEASLLAWIQNPLIRLLTKNHQNSYTLLSHEKAQVLDPHSQLAALYRREINHSIKEEIESKLKSVKIFYWSSFFQYQIYCQNFPFIKDHIHCCGLGKTFGQFQKANITVFPFINKNEFKTWIKNEPNK